MRYHIMYPSPALSGIVRYYYLRLKRDPSEIITEHCRTPLIQGLAFGFRDRGDEGCPASQHIQAFIFGQPTSPRVIRVDKSWDKYLGVVFGPLGITAVTGINMEHIADRAIPAGDVFGTELKTLCEKMQLARGFMRVIDLLEKFLLKKFLETSLNYRVNDVANALCLLDRTQGKAGVQELRDYTHTSRKTLERAFHHFLGLGPKLYARILRYNAARKALEQAAAPPRISDVAYDLGYCDTSHFAADFKHFSGMTPKRYLDSLLGDKLRLSVVN